MSAHRCKFPDAKKYPTGSVFSCEACGRTFALVAQWVDRPELRQRRSVESGAQIDIFEPENRDG